MYSFWLKAVFIKGMEFPKSAEEADDSCHAIESEEGVVRKIFGYACSRPRLFPFSLIRGAARFLGAGAPDCALGRGVFGSGSSRSRTLSGVPPHRPYFAFQRRAARKPVAA